MINEKIVRLVYITINRVLSDHFSGEVRLETPDDEFGFPTDETVIKEVSRILVVSKVSEVEK